MLVGNVIRVWREGTLVEWLFLLFTLRKYQLGKLLKGFVTGNGFTSLMIKHI